MNPLEAKIMLGQLRRKLTYMTTKSKRIALYRLLYQGDFTTENGRDYVESMPDEFCETLVQQWISALATAEESLTKSDTRDSEFDPEDGSIDS